MRLIHTGGKNQSAALLSPLGGEGRYKWLVPSFCPLCLDSLWHRAHTLERAVMSSRVPVVLAGSDGVFQ